MKIIKEGRAERCEICHQIDQFDITNGKCKRCLDLVIETVPQSSKKRTSIYKSPHFFIPFFSMFIITLLSFWLTNLVVGIWSCFVLRGALQMFAKEDNNKMLGYPLAIVMLICTAFMCDFRVSHTGNFSIKVLPICYGYLSTEGLNKVKRGECVAGSCVISPFSSNSSIIITY